MHEALSGSPLIGRLSARGALASRGGHPAEFRRNLQGSLHLECRDGRLDASSLAVKLLSLASIQALFQPGSLDLRGRGIPYRSLIGDFRIRDGMARTDNLVADSPAFLASSVGHVDLADETLEITTAIRPLKVLDAALAGIPVAGWLLGGKEGGLVVAYARASGPIREPRIEGLPLQSVGDSLFGTFRRLLRLPAALPGEGASSAPPDSPKASGKRGADARDTQ
jgi:hypothetical protein